MGGLSNGPIPDPHARPKPPAPKPGVIKSPFEIAAKQFKLLVWLHFPPAIVKTQSLSARPWFDARSPSLACRMSAAIFQLTGARFALHYQLVGFLSFVTVPEKLYDSCLEFENLKLVCRPTKKLRRRATDASTRTKEDSLGGRQPSPRTFFAKLGPRNCLHCICWRISSIYTWIFVKKSHMPPNNEMMVFGSNWTMRWPP